uniref:Uncharacterized protein n=1 Tax=Ursus americanus TaxID=9643 RepID=A0A452QG88_URSAM
MLSEIRVNLIDIYADKEFNQNPEFSNTDQIDLYDAVSMATSLPSDDRSSNTESPPPVCQEPSPSPATRPLGQRTLLTSGSLGYWSLPVSQKHQAMETQG